MNGLSFPGRGGLLPGPGWPGWPGRDHLFLRRKCPSQTRWRRGGGGVRPCRCWSLTQPGRRGGGEPSKVHSTCANSSLPNGSRSPTWSSNYFSPARQEAGASGGPRALPRAEAGRCSGARSPSRLRVPRRVVGPSPSRLPALCFDTLLSVAAPELASLRPGWHPERPSGPGRSQRAARLRRRLGATSEVRSITRCLRLTAMSSAGDPALSLHCGAVTLTEARGSGRGRRPQTPSPCPAPPFRVRSVCGWGVGCVTAINPAMKIDVPAAEQSRRGPVRPDATGTVVAVFSTWGFMGGGEEVLSRAVGPGRDLSAARVGITAPLLIRAGPHTAAHGRTRDVVAVAWPGRACLASWPGCHRRPPEEATEGAVQGSRKLPRSIEESTSCKV